MKLLADIKEVFCDGDHMGTEALLARLHKLEESPWGDLKGKPLDARGLARRLRPYDIKPTNIRHLAEVVKGYRREDLHDAWQRYLGPPAYERATAATAATFQANAA